MGDNNRQAKDYHKQRKAKARALHAKHYNNYASRQRKSLPMPRRTLFRDQPAVSEQMLCRLFGEEYRP